MRFAAACCAHVLVEPPLIGRGMDDAAAVALPESLKDVIPSAVSGDRLHSRGMTARWAGEDPLIVLLRRGRRHRGSGLMACGSVIQRSTQSGFNRSFASRKLGAVATCRAPVLPWRALSARRGCARDRLRAMSFSLAVSVVPAPGCTAAVAEIAWKKRTSLRIRLSEKENVGMRTFR